MFLLGWLGVGVFCHAYSLLPSPLSLTLKLPVAMNVMIMLDIMITWGIGFSTAFNRAKSGGVIAEEDRNLPGFNVNADDPSSSVLSKTLQEIQLKNCELTLLLYMVLFILGTAGSPAEDDGVIAVLFFFFFSRITYLVLAVLGMRRAVLSGVGFFSAFLVTILCLWQLIARIRSPSP